MRAVRVHRAAMGVMTLALLLASGGLDTKGFEDVPGHDHPTASSGLVLLSLAGPPPLLPDAEDHETCGASCVSFTTTLVATVGALALTIGLVAARVRVSPTLAGPRSGPRLATPPPR